MNDIIKSGDTHVSRGADMFMPPAEAMSAVVELLAKRIYRDRWEVPDDHLEADWLSSPKKVHDEFRKYAMSALGFMRETIQMELQRTNSSLDISREMPEKQFAIDWKNVPSDIADRLEFLAAVYHNNRPIDPGHFTLHIKASYKLLSYGSEPEVLGVVIREEPR